MTKQLRKKTQVISLELNSLNTQLYDVVEMMETSSMWFQAWLLKIIFFCLPLNVASV